MLEFSILLRTLSPHGVGNSPQNRQWKNIRLSRWQDHFKSTNW